MRPSLILASNTYDMHVRSLCSRAAEIMKQLDEMEKLQDELNDIAMALKGERIRKYGLKLRNNFKHNYTASQTIKLRQYELIRV